MSKMAWAVVAKDGEVNIRSVSDSDVGAMVNWLITEHRVVASDVATDTQIRKVFTHYSAETGCRAKQVHVRVAYQ